MKISFKKIDETDFDIIINFMRKFNEHEKLPFDENLAKELLLFLVNYDEEGFVYLISADDQPVGYIAIAFGFSFEFRGKDAFIDEFYIDENYRRKGIGTEAMRFAVKVCNDLGVKALHLEVDKQNLKAQNVYRKEGFKDHDRYLMTKWINE